MKTRETLSRLLTGKNLRESESKSVFLRVFGNQLSESEVKSLLLLLARKGETAEEISGCVQALKSYERPIASPLRGLMDTCGTGGDGGQTFNISTLAAFVIAGAGGRVAKHGNRSISSQCGSSDLMGALGIRLDCPKRRMLQAIRECGIGYFHAPIYHPTFAKMQPLRQKLKVRTIFNLLGPLVNPLAVKHQIIGVAKAQYAGLYAKVLTRLSYKRAWVCHSEDGLDEISIQKPTRVYKVEKRRVSSFRIDPRQFGIAKASLATLKGGTISKNKSIALSLLENRLKGPRRAIVALNAAGGLVVARKAKNLAQGLILAEESISSGYALKALEGLRKISRLG